MTRTVRPRTNVHFYPSTFRFESRMLKETATALASGAVDDVLILARWEPGLAEREDIDADRRVRRLRTPIGDRLAGPIGSVVRLLEWQVRAFVAIVRARPVLLNPHSLPVLPVAMAAKVVTRAEVIYDTHELETETVGSSALRRRIGRLLEWSFVRFCTAVVVVNESIGEWYRAHHPSARVVVVRNVPYRTSHPVERTDAFRSLLSIPDADLVFLYQGSIHRGRAAEMLLDVFVDMPTDRHMVFMGYGDLEPTIRAASTQRSNIHFVAAVPPGEVLAMTASADVGICLIENVCVSYHLSLPNKLMEYTSAGIPTIASAFPEMSRFITDTGAGWTVEVEPGAVAALIRSLDADAIAAAAARAREARSRLSWEDESVPLVDLYRSIGSRLGR